MSRKGVPGKQRSGSIDNGGWTSLVRSRKGNQPGGDSRTIQFRTLALSIRSVGADQGHRETCLWLLAPEDGPSIYSRRRDISDVYLLWCSAPVRPGSLDLGGRFLLPEETVCLVWQSSLTQRRRLLDGEKWSRSSLCNLCVLCVSVVDVPSKNVVTVPRV